MRVPYRKPGKFSQMKPDPLMTKAKFNELTQELERLKKKRPQAAAEVARLAELGDFSENAEYQLAKGRLRGINNAILRLESELNQAEIIKPSEQTETVQIGHTVTVENEGKSPPERDPASRRWQKTYQILGSSETKPERGIISHNSPIGSALMGRAVGDEARVKLADREVAYKIVKIE